MSAIDLIVLGMIKEKEQSAYDLQKNIEYRNISKWVKVSTPSIYKKVVQLEKKGYIQGNLSKEGNMPEKSIYHITESGDRYFLGLMKKISDQMINIFLNFNAVVINLEMVSSRERKELTENIEYQINQFQNAVSQLDKERTDIPLTGKTILKQQVLLSEALDKWITDFRDFYLEE
ncbi:PadR family transcriptional regulator [Peptostreptococcus canis]|uniref:PadR family transcriptional regulator n=1 Tax=Peptostreptococcus canis TaxID=1159213 RepID=A0ABR6TJU1_9FIRM|nr:PadR family transcriptional regulator [Peptostreptococcus canis]MBC2575575.1 PadR family transcriptional regulator [Peptostreptococcus canis]MBP1997226.1 DNA-binding PadR family transcriptional regulator [Peptostreptococcus canis]